MERAFTPSPETGPSLVQSAVAAPLSAPRPAPTAKPSASEMTTFSPPLAPPQSLAQAEPKLTPAPVLVPARPIHAAPRARAASSGEGRYTVQVGAFRSADNARSLEQRLDAAGFHASITPFSDRKGGAMYRVHIGRFANPGKAAPTRASVKSRGIDAIVVSLD